MKSHKIRLELNHRQATLAKKHAGASRYAYNWGLFICKTGYASKTEDEVYKRPSAIDLHKLWVSDVKSQQPWTYEVSKCSPQEAFRNLDRAYKRAFTVQGARLPQFKKKGVHDSFYLEGAIHVKGKKIKLPKFGWVKCSEELPEVTLKNVTVSRQGKHWFVSFKTELLPQKLKGIEEQASVGVDLGIKTLATLSDGTFYENKRPYKRLKRALKLAQRQASKKYKKGQQQQSENYQKAQQKVAQLHYRIACIRKDALHQLTSHLAKNHSRIVIEDLNVKGMSKNHKLASAILDGGFYEFRRQLAYKTAWYGSKLVVAHRFYPSSKTCSSCGAVHPNLQLKDRVYKCSSCHLELDRDLNAALNLKKYTVSYTESACGEVKPPKANRLRTSMKQEINNSLNRNV